VEILYSDADIIVCVKPVGVDSEHEMPQLLSGTVYTLHRLDKNVGGVMVYARTKQAAARLSRDIQEGLLEKEYLALVHGIPPKSGDWEDLLFKDSRKNKVFVVKKQRSGVKSARLSYTRLTDDNPSLVRIRLYTGRSHQIRVQFSSRGYPLVGDHKYGSRAKETEPRLFCCCLRFAHKGEMRSFSASPDWV